MESRLTVVLVANGFDQDISVKVKNKPIASTSFSEEILPRETDAIDIAKQGEGAMIVLADETESKAFYLTVFYKDGEGNERYIVQDLALQYGAEKSYAAIVTKTGDIVDATNHHSWIDSNGINHRQDPCPRCSEMSCSRLCKLESNLSQIGESIDVIKDCQLAKYLLETIEELQQNDVGKEKEVDLKNMIKELEDLSSKCSLLEVKTKRAVGAVKVYGVGLKQEADDFVEDIKKNGLRNDFCPTRADINDAKKNLERANEIHTEIKIEMLKIRVSAEANAKRCAKKASDANETSAAAGEVNVAASGSNNRMDDNRTDDIKMKATLFSIILSLHKPIANAKHYKKLEKQLKTIAQRMQLVGKHLEKITTSLYKIEQNLKLTKNAENIAFYTEDVVKIETMAKRVIEAAGLLVKACDCYFKIVNDETPDNALSVGNSISTD